MTPEWFRTFQRAMQHRQKRQRIARYFDCTWQSAWGPIRSRISSISPTGCYIEDRFTVPAPGEAVAELSFDVPTGRLRLQGSVLEATPGVGFAVRFTALSPDTRSHLSSIVEWIRRERQ